MRYLGLYYKLLGQGLEEGMTGMTNEEHVAKIVQKVKDERIKVMEVYIEHGINDNRLSQIDELVMAYHKIANQPIEIAFKPTKIDL